MRSLPPLLLKDKYYRYIRQEIERLMDEILYRPLAVAMNVRPSELKNSNNALLSAVQRGQVWYDNGEFHGKFNAPISAALRRIGAKWNPKSKTWSLPPASVPAQISIALADAQMNYRAMQSRVVQTLDSIHVESISKLSTTPERYKQTITWMEGDFQKTVDAITIPPTLTETQQDKIAEEWGQNLNLYIQKWTEENILKLREEVQTNAFAGQRAAVMVKHIQHNYAVSRRKAEFLARQETSLLMSKFRETRYRDIGANTYRWHGSMDARERPDHKALEGKVFSWTSPPVVDRKNGRRGNPGDDFGCRCVAVALLS